MKTMIAAGIPIKTKAAIAIIRSADPNPTDAGTSLFLRACPQKGQTDARFATFLPQPEQAACVKRTATFLVQRRMPGRPWSEIWPPRTVSAGGRTVTASFAAGAAATGAGV